MILEKYAPRSTRDFIGNAAAVADMKKFLAGWRKGRALLVYGPTGSGKSAAIRLTAQEAGYELVEIHANEERSTKDFLQASTQQGVFSKKRIMLFEDIETMPVRGFGQIIRESMHPVVCTVNDAYKLSASARKDFRLLKFEKIKDADLIRFAGDVCKKERIICEKRDLEQLVKMSSGDIRSLLIDLDAFRLGFKHGGYRDTEDNIFNTLKVIFKTMSIENSRIAAENSDKDGEELFRWLEQNISEEYTDMTTIAAAYDYLSKADIFRSRIIRRQSWGLQKYFFGMSVYGTSLAKNRPSVRFVSYRPPVFVRRMNDPFLEKIGKHLHVSRKQSAAYVPIIRMLAKRKSNICEEMGMDEKEISLIMGS